MNIILLDKVANLGSLGDQVVVKAGYARNYLYPQGKAVPATKENIKNFEVRRAELEKRLNTQLAAAKEKAEKLTALNDLTIVVKAGDEGKLFGSVGTKDIAETITEAGVAVGKSEVKLPHGTIRETGEYDISLQIHAEVSTTVKISVIAEA